MLYFKTQLTNVNCNQSSSYQQISPWNTSPVLNSGGFSVSNTYITVPETAVYIIHFTIYVFNNDNSREAPGFIFQINNSNQNEESGSTYMRNNDHNQASTSLTVAYSLSGGDQISLANRQFGDTNTCQVQGSESSISIYNLD